MKLKHARHWPAASSLRLLLLFFFSLTFISPLLAQTKQIQGVITTSDGAPLSGVNVSVKGSNTGTVSNDAGRYSIQAGPGSVLQFSYAGYFTKEVSVDAQSQVDVSMEENMQALDNVVVIGYGTQKKALRQNLYINLIFYYKPIG